MNDNNRKIIGNQIIKREKELSEEEYTQLFEISKNKVKKNIIFLIFGIFIAISGFLMFIYELILFIPVAITTLGLYLIARFTLKVNYLRRNSGFLPYNSENRERFSTKNKDLNHINYIKTRSFASSRLIAAIPPLLLAVFNIWRFGLGLGQNLVGTWFVLGGPSLFYPTSLFPMIVSFTLIISTLITSRIISFAKTKHLLTIKEFRFFIPLRTEIPIDKIQAIQMSNAKMGPKYAWLFILGLHMIWCFYYAFAFLFNPFAFGYAYYVGFAYLESAIIQLGVILILVLKSQTIIEIITDERRYALHLSLPAATPNLIHILENFLEVKPNPFHLEKFEDNRLNNVYSTYGNYDLTNIITGLIFIILSIIFKSTWIFSNDPLRMTLIMFGMLLIIKGIKKDFVSNREGLNIKFDSINEVIYYNREFAWMNESFKIKNCGKNSFQIKPLPPKLGFFEWILGIIIPIFTGMVIGSHMRFVPIINLIWLMIFPYIIIALLIMVLIFNVLIKPVQTLKINTKSVDYDIEIPGIRLFEEDRNFHKTREQNQGLRYFILKMKKSLELDKQTSIRRLSVILISFIIGIIISFVF